MSAGQMNNDFWAGLQPTPDTTKLLSDVELQNRETSPVRVGVGATRNGAVVGMAAQAPAPAQSNGATMSFCGALSVEFYRPYFDVDTEQVKERLMRAALPCIRREQAFLDTMGTYPDLYGPFWIAITLVFVIGVTGNFISWETYSGAGWTYDFQIVVRSVFVVFGFLAAGAGGLRAVSYYLELGLDLAQVLCLWGYSFALYVPMAAACVLPASAVQWGALLGGSVAGSAFLVAGLVPVLAAKAPAQAMPVIGGVCLLQVAFFLVLKLMFY